MTRPPIEHGVPIPPRAKGRPRKYDFAALTIGASFWAPVRPSTMQDCVRRATRDLPGRAFTTRAETRNGVAGVRCWRTA